MKRITTKEEFPITRILKRHASVMLIPLEGNGYCYRIRKGDQTIYLTVDSFGKVKELTHNEKKLSDRKLWSVLKLAEKRGCKFYRYTYILRDNNE